MGWVIYHKISGEKHASAVMNHIVPNLESLGYIFAAENLGLTSVSFVYLAPKAMGLGEMMPNNDRSHVANSELVILAVIQSLQCPVTGCGPR